MFNAHSLHRRFNTLFVSISTKQRICQQSAIDYCCLNMELPPECNDEKVEIHCSLDHNKLGEFRIQPWQQPDINFDSGKIDTILSYQQWLLQ